MRGSCRNKVGVFVALVALVAGGCHSGGDAQNGTLADVRTPEVDVADAGDDPAPDLADASLPGEVDTGDAPDVSDDAGDPAPRAERVVHQLPIEVLGAPGVAVATTVDLDAERVRRASSATLVLTIHNLVGADSARLFVNDQGSVDLSSRSAGLLRPTGGTARATLDIPTQWLHAGQNTLTFQYTRQVPDVSGYRVLALELQLDARPAAALSEWEDPSQWHAPDETAATVELGRQYFAEISRDGGPTCARCHADSGADLQYYAFSNESIVARAMFHEFTRREAEAIASYIRTLDVPIEGRAYNAPFQPGEANRGAAGAGYDAVLSDDASFANRLYQQQAIPHDLAWGWPRTLDTFVLPTTVELPSWFRWLPREIDPQWFTRQGGALADAEQALAADPSMANAHAFMSAAVEIGKEVMVEQGDHHGRVELLRFAAVKLWDWSRKHGFDDADHGFPNDAYGEHGHHGSPAYPYEVGFAFFEAAQAGMPYAMKQASEWWWAQIAVDPGRGRSNGARPLDWADVLRANEFQVGPAELGFLHVYGTWEESRGPMSDAFGEGHGPARLLKLPMFHLPLDDKIAIWKRFLREQTRFVADGGELSQGHLNVVAEAWQVVCPELTDAQRQALQEMASAAAVAEMTDCW